MINCKQVITTVSSEEKTNWAKKIEVKMHLAICIHCRKYLKHLEIIKTAFKRLFLEKSKNHSKQIKQIEDKIISKIK